MIDGVTITSLKNFSDDRGQVIKMIDNKNKQITKFGEIYFSTINYEAIKAWHYHKKMTINYLLISGSIKFVLFDDRKSSNTRGKFSEINLSDNNFQLITVPPMIWNGFKGLEKKKISIVANYTDIPHDEHEIIRKEPFDKTIPYDWSVN